jgi:hypothetical protein|tara:strand:- start:1288 stop:1911 length:624 start_codon:yes stop_codon:yes gene_type:complete
MESNKEFNALLQVLAGEQQVIQRTDQKAFTLLSILGVFMVFFIVHFPKIQMNFFIFLMMMVYFTSAMGTIYYLVRVIVPRIRKRKKPELDRDLELTFIDKMTNWISNYKIHNDYEDIEKDEVINPTFFAGISRFKSSSEYAVYLKSIAENEDGLYKMFASQVFALGNINQLKNENIRLALYFFISALLSELLIIMSMAYSRALPYLF